MSVKFIKEKYISLSSGVYSNKTMDINKLEIYPSNALNIDDEEVDNEVENLVDNEFEDDLKDEAEESVGLEDVFSDDLVEEDSGTLERLSDEEIDENMRRRQEKIKEAFIKEQRRLESLGLLTDEEKEKQDDELKKQLENIKNTYEEGQEKIKKNFFLKMDDEKLEAKGYPKQKLDPTDIEYDEKGNPQYFFNIKKTLASKNMLWLLKIFGEERLVALTYNNDFLNNYADVQHEKVAKYNNMSAQEQYFNDYKKKFILGIVLSIVIIVAGVRYASIKIPERKYKEAMSAYNVGNYQVAYESFDKLGNDDKALYYKDLSLLKAFMADKDFDSAYELAETFTNHAQFITEDEYNDMLKDILLSKAKTLYQSKKFEEAIDVFEELPKDEEVNNYIKNSYYQIAETSFNEGRKEDAIKQYGKVRGFKDVDEKIEMLSVNYYDEAISLYNKKKYKEAKEKFDILKEANYKDSDSMSKQCLYKQGLDMLEEEKYDEAVKHFNEIQSFKDSLTMANEAIYKKASNLLLVNPAQANIELSKIRRYKDVEELITLPNISIYGEWDIVEADGSPVEDVSFLFNDKNEILSNKPIKNLKISQPAKIIKYDTVGNEFTSTDGESTIKVEVMDNGNKMKLIADDKNSSIEYLCERKQSLGRYLGLSGKLIEVEGENDIPKEYENILKQISTIYIK